MLCRVGNGSRAGSTEEASSNTEIDVSAVGLGKEVCPGWEGEEVGRWVGG